MDTVLVGGLSVLAVMGAVFYTQHKINTADIMPNTKKMLNFGLVLVIVGAAAIAIDWHSSVWLANR